MDNTEFKILLVDDSELNLKIAENFISKLGFPVELAESGEEAIKLIESSPYSLVLMDYLMPNINGAEATKIIRELDSDKFGENYFKNLPIIALTAEESKKNDNIFFEAGMNDILRKPFTINGISDIIKKYMKSDSDIPGITNEAIKDILESDLDSFIELVSIFHEDTENKLKTISETLKNKDYELYTVEVHRLKGESQMIGALELASHARILEFAGKAVTGAYGNGKTDDENYQTIDEDTPKVLEELTALDKNLEIFLSKHSVTTEAPTVEEVQSFPEKDKIKRYVGYALDSLNSENYVMVKNWLEEIMEVIDC